MFAGGSPRTEPQPVDWFGGSGGFFSNQTQPMMTPESAPSINEENKDEEKRNLYKSPAGIDNPSNDIVVPSAPTDTITSLYFSPRNNSTDFVVTTWDKQVRHYRTIRDIDAVQKTAHKSGSPKAHGGDGDDEQKENNGTTDNNAKLFGIPQLLEIKYHDKPVLDACWNGNDANKLYTVGCDRVVKVWDLEKNVFSVMDFQPSPSQSVSTQNDRNQAEQKIEDDDSKQAELATQSTKGNQEEETKNASNDQEDEQAISQDVRSKITNKIGEWHPDIVDQVARKLFSECDEVKCKVYLHDLITFRVKVDNLALQVAADEIKNAGKSASPKEADKEEKKKTTASRGSGHSGKKSIKYLHHAEPIRCVKYIAENNVLITGSWDKKIKYWDTRSKICCGSIDLGHKVYCMASLTPILTLGLSNKHIQVYDLRNPSQVIINKTTPLKHQLRCMDIFPSKDGFAVGSIEGRVAVEMTDPKEAKKKNFSFKCHRHTADKDEHNNGRIDNNVGGDISNQQNVYGVNTLAFHPNGSFITGGSDGQINFWDKVQRSRLKHTPRMKLPIVATAFNYNASLLAYATSYDWSSGASGYDPKTHKPQIYIHTVEASDIDRRATGFGV